MSRRHVRIPRSTELPVRSELARGYIRLGCRQAIYVERIPPKKKAQNLQNRLHLAFGRRRRVLFDVFFPIVSYCLALVAGCCCLVRHWLPFAGTAPLSLLPGGSRYSVLGNVEVSSS